MAAAKIKKIGKKPKISSKVKDLAADAVKGKREQFILPIFDEEKFFADVNALVEQAPGGIIQFFIDLFCGAGGTSEGIEQARLREAARDIKNSMIICGVNHDKKAIYSQAINHPNAYYTDEDIRFANLKPIVSLVKKLRALYPQCPIIIWASLECTNHSNAKGGMSRDPDSRTLPWELYRYIKAIKPDGIWIENVKEFSEWGPMMTRMVMTKGKKRHSLKDLVPLHMEKEFFEEKINTGWVCSSPLEYIKDGKGKKAKKIGQRPEWVPIKSMKGTFYLKWLEEVDTYGFHHQWRILNAADFGAPTNRHRLFIVFMKKGWPITFPHPTHCKNPKAGDMFDPGLKKHVAVKTCLKFDVEGRSVFIPGHVDSEKTWERVYEGLVKYVAGGKKEYAYMVQRNGGNPLSRIFPVDSPARTVTTTGGNQELVQAFLIKYMGNNEKTGSNAGLSIENPANTITVQPRLGIIQPMFLMKYNSASNNTSVNKGASIEDPAPTITCRSGVGLIKADFLDVIYGKGTPSSMEKPSPTVRTKDGMAIVSPKFILNYQGQSNANSIDEPAPTLMTQEKLALMDVKYFLYRAYSAGGYMGSIDNPEGSVTTNPKTALMEVEGWIMDTHYDNIGTGLEEPGTTITANRKWSYLMNPSWFGSIGSTEDPAVTIIARQDKAPIYLLSVDESSAALAIPVFEDDLPIVVKIKEFMALYNIYDIKKRMLMVPELLAIQSFPADYYLAGSKTDQKKFIGNAVPPLVAKAIAESMYWPTVEHICKKRNINLKNAA